MDWSFLPLPSLPPPRLPLVLPAHVEPVSRSAWDHGAGPRLSGQAANDIIQKVTPLVTVTHYLSHPPSSHSESDLIVVMSVCCVVIQRSVETYVFFFIIIILKY